MTFDRIVCYIYNNIYSEIVSKTFGDIYTKETRISLDSFIAGLIITIFVVILMSWWLIPLRYIRTLLINSTKDIVFVCPKEENK